MKKTNIDWCDYTINPVKGLCPVGCSYCYARRMYKRFKWDETIRFDWSVANDVAKMKRGSKVFWGSTMELFGDWVDPDDMRLIFDYIRNFAQDKTHIFLTKQPQNLIKWSPFPENCWVGVSATNTMMFQKGTAYLHGIKASVKFVSLEPLLDWDMDSNCMYGYLKERNINWLIIGQQTPVRQATMPKIKWVKEIVEAADKTGVKVFLKDNLDSFIPEHDRLLRVQNKPASQIICPDCPSLLTDDCPKCDVVWGLRQEFPVIAKV